MGSAVAGHLATAGHKLRVYNRSTEKTDRWLESFSGTKAKTPAEAAMDADFVFSCVGNDDSLKAVALGEEGALATLKEGAIYIDHTTASAEIAKVLYGEANKKKIGFLDAPLSGGQAGAENGELSIMIGGDENVYAQAQPLMKNYAKSTNLIGDCGSGQYAKMVNQICIAGLLQGLSEGLHFGVSMGLDLDRVIDSISMGAAQSWQMDNRAKTMVAKKFDFGFAVDWMRKDLAIVLEEAARQQVELPITPLIDGYYAQIQDMGGGRWDTSSLVSLLGKKDQK